VHKARILRIDRDHPQARLIAEAAETVRNGGVIAYLTDTLYGIGADALNPAAVQKVFAIKSRSGEKALPVIIGHRDMLSKLVVEISADAEELIAHFWPGPLSLILLASPVLPGILHGNLGKIAVRVPACAVARELAAACGGALTATSANRSGAAPSQNIEDVLARLGNDIDLFVDSGPAIETRPSTMVDVTVSPARLLREGALSFGKLNAVVKIQR
jgi:L-threonylcarbamoyladenylate synthase